MGPARSPAEHHRKVERLATHGHPQGGGGGALATNPDYSPTFLPSTSLIYNHNNILRMIFL